MKKFLSLEDKADVFVSALPCVYTIEDIPGEKIISDVSKFKDAIKKVNTRYGYITYS